MPVHFDCVLHDGRIKQFGITERHIDGGFQGAKGGQRDDPVAENTVMDGFIFQFGRQLTFGDGVDFREIFLK